MSFKNFSVPYSIDDRYSTKVAYFSMEFAVHQPLKFTAAAWAFWRARICAVLMNCGKI